MHHNCKTKKGLVDLLAEDILKQHGDSFQNHKFLKVSNILLAPEPLTIFMKNCLKNA
jgi:hypothetical protein